MASRRGFPEARPDTGRETGQAKRVLDSPKRIAHKSASKDRQHKPEEQAAKKGRKHRSKAQAASKGRKESCFLCADQEGEAMAVHVVDHPLIRHKLGILRAASTGTNEFRRIAGEMAALLVYEATRSFATHRRVVEGWAGPVEVEEIEGKKVTVVPILRAGLGLMDGVLAMMPGAKISVVGLYRNEETLAPVEYYAKFASDLENRMAIVLDPMLATGGSLVAAIDLLKERGSRHICSLNLVCAPEGIAMVEEKHPDVDIYTAAVDEGLNERGYILPGLGDAGDRIFGTK